MLLHCGVGEDSWSPLDSKEIQPVYPKGNQSWIFFRRTDAKAETPILWLPDVKNWFEKTLMLRKIEGRRRRGRQDEMIGWHHRLNWTWVWVSSESWWRTGKPGVLWSMGLQRVGDDWATELKAIKFIKEKRRVNLHALPCIWQRILRYNNKSMKNSSKNKKVNFIKIKIFVLQRTPLRKWNIFRMGEHVCQISEKGLVSKNG